MFAYLAYSYSILLNKRRILYEIDEKIKKLYIKNYVKSK